MNDLCEHYNHLDLAWLRRQKLLRPGTSSLINWTTGGQPSGSIRIEVGVDTILLIYRTRSYGEDWQDRRELVRFRETNTKFGGRRRWFACPRCGRVCRVLLGGGRFLCRRCQWLALSVTARVRLEPGHQPGAEDQEAPSWLGRPAGAVPSAPQAYAAPDLRQAQGTRRQFDGGELGGLGHIHGQALGPDRASRQLEKQSKRIKPTISGGGSPPRGPSSQGMRYLTRARVLRGKPGRTHTKTSPFSVWRALMITGPSRGLRGSYENS
jgi:hypothetical protein